MQLFSDRIRLHDRQLRNVAPFCAAGAKGSRYMKMQVTYCLISWHTIVLPYGNAGSTVSEINYACSMTYFFHYHIGFFVGKVENRCTVTYRHDQQMRYTALLTSNQNSGKFSAKEDGIGPITSEICTEGALGIYG